MRIESFRQITAKAAYFSSFFALLSMFILTNSTFAQAPDSNSLEGLVEKLEELGGKAGQLSGQLGVGSAIDSARKSAVEGFARSPFGRPDGSEHAELNTRFSVGELLLIERHCKGNSTFGDERILGIMTEFSSIERDYCRRVSERVLQIGYNVFDGVITPELLVNGTIGDDYILGIGDELVITFEGKKNENITVWIDREGRLSHQDIGRLPAAGKSFGELRRDLVRLTERTQFGTKVFLSMGSVRLTTVRVTGEVRHPGLHQITGLSSIFDAITIAGGIKKTGSLRSIQVKRDDRIFWLDAYDLMFPHFGGQDLGLRDGDHILVPTLGKTIAVAGDVKRKGIFELPEGQSKISIDEAIKLAGGYIRSRGNKLLRMSFDDSGRETLSSLGNNQDIVHDGEILIVKRTQNTSTGTIAIEGHISSPGTKSLASFPSVRTLLLQGNSFKPNPYLLFGILETTDPATRARRYFPINLQEIVDGRLDYALRENDKLIVLSHDEVRYLASDDVRMVITESLGSAEIKANGVEEEIGKKAEELAAKLIRNIDGANSLAGALDRDKSLAGGKSGDRISSGRQNGFQYSCLGLRSLATILRFSRTGRFASVVQAMGGTVDEGFVNPRTCPAIFDKSPDLLPFVLEHAVAVNGEVRKPGAYPVVKKTPVSAILAVSGGLSLDADVSQVEISHYSGGKNTRRSYDFSAVKMHDVSIGPGDLAKFNPLFKDRDNGPILLSGEFARPGLYDIRRGERLSEVIARAGGLTDQAYPYGAVFTRERVRTAQQIAFRRAAKELRSTAIYAAGKSGGSSEGLAALQQFTDDVVDTEALGRVVIEADPTVLSVRPELDTVLEPGDKVFLPKRPNSVLVIGDVLNPGAMQFIAGTKADAYIDQAGGMRQSADGDRMFLVYPNGVAQPVSVSVWNYNPVQVPPGSTLVVPMDPAPLDIFTFAKDMTALISQMAITAASLAVIGNN
jgi:polysaccharide biosynthesis/export protein